jgi:tetratricopeptide (TPR) repeat protein
LLQDDPENEAAYAQLSESIGKGEVEGMTREEVGRLLASARHAHEGRRECDAAASLLELEVLVAEGGPMEAELLIMLGRTCEQELFDDQRALSAYERVTALSDAGAITREATDAIERISAKRGKWNDLVVRYVEEANAAGEPSFKSSLLVSAAEMAYRYGRAATQGEKGAKKKLAALNADIGSRLEEAFRLDPRSRRAAALLERIYREQKKWEDVAQLLEKMASESTAKEEKTAGFVRLARVLTKKLGSPERAVAAYERVLDLSPGNVEATSALVDFFTSREMWDHLVSLYDEQLSASQRAGHPDPGIALQIAMVHWRMRGRADAAEPYFEKLRRLEPAHPGMLNFFREHLGQKGDTARLAQILTDAQRAMPDGPPRAAIGVELAKLAEEGANASKAIEQWRALLRQDPTNKDARDALKRLYRQTAAWPALGDLLRGELEKTAADDKAARLPILRDIAALYRDHLKNDAGLVSVLTQISGLDPTDADTVRELVRVYEALGRARDLLSAQSRLAELESDPGTKAELHRQVARRYLEQFSNVQNATEAYEKLLEAKPGDAEATEKLKELYTKRRAYKPLYDLMEREASGLSEGPERRNAWIEMAKLAGERLDRAADAVQLYKKVLEEEPGALAALDALEKLAEREKDYVTVADALERRLAVADGEQAKLAVLQKLGVLYSERLQDPKGTVRTFRRVLEVSPGNAKALRVLRDAYLGAGDYDGLEALFAESQDWEGLADVLSSAADRATDAAAKVELSFRSADVYVAKIGVPERAFRAYERVLSVRPDDARAAGALIPLYEKEERWPRLPPLYEVLLGHASSDAEKLELLAKLVTITSDKLQDGGAAFRYARKAYELAPQESGALDKLEAVARKSREWNAFVEAIEAREKSASSDAEKRALAAKKAEIAATELGKVDDAITTYRALVEQNPDDETAVSALDRILRSADRRDDLRWLYDLRVERANTSQKIELLVEWATLEEEALAAPDHAAKLYRRILEMVPKHGRALRALARLLQSSGDAAEAAAMLERERDQREGPERAAREIELAKLYAGPLKRPNDALEATKRALELVPNDAAAVAQLEELLNVPQTRGRVAAVLEGIYADRGDGERQAQIIEVLLATTAAKADRLPLYERLLGVHEGRNDLEMAFDVGVRATTDFPMELALWDRLSVLANRTQKTPQFVEAIAAALPDGAPSGLSPAVEVDLAERAATMYDEALGDIERARPYLERVLRIDPTNERAFARLKQILTSLERWDDLEALYERTVAASEESRRADLLAEVALLAEEIIGDRVKAIRYYERILDLDRAHEQATRALDALYAAEQAWDRLAALLERRLEGASGDEAQTLRLRLGALHAEKLGSGGRALDYLEAALTTDPASHEARDLVEKLLGEPTLRPRAAVILEAVYVAQDHPRDLVRILEVRLESAAEGERAELLRRAAELRDERLNEDVAALDTYARLVPIAPDDGHARERLLDLARRVGAHEQAASVLAQAAKTATAPQPRGEILSQVAHIYEDLLGDTAKAEAVYREVLALDENDASLTLPAARALEKIYAAGGRAEELAKMLAIQVRLEEDAAVKRELRGRLGDLHETQGDRAAAIQVWRDCVQDDSADERALAALDRLYAAAGEHRALASVLRQREALTSDGNERKALMLRLAETLADKLSDVNEAITAYRAVLDDFGAERPVLAALASLYEVADRYPELAETLEAELAMVDAPADRLALLARLGEVRRKRLADVPGALDAYRQALTLDPAHAPSRAALEELLEDPNARRDAAETLRPLYEADGEHKKLLRVLDIEADYADSPTDKLALFAQAAMVAEQSLGDANRAFDDTARGVRQAVAEPELPNWLERAERLAAATNRFKDLMELFKAIAPEVLDENLQLDVTLKVAELAEARLADVPLARTYYEKALAIRDTDVRTLSALERLYDALSDHVALRGILEKRAEGAEDDGERKDYLFKLAKLCDEKLGDPRAAIETYERILDLGLDAEAVAQLERLYAAAARWDDLVALYERQIGADPDAEQKASLHQALGNVFEKRLTDFERAFGEYEAALKLSAQHGKTVASLEGLMQSPEHAARAAEMLEAVYLARLDWRRVMGTVEARLAVSQDPDERRELLRRLAKLHEEQEENYPAALETTAKLLAEDVTDEGTWAELERLARVANADARLAQIYAAELDKVSVEEGATAKLAKRTGELFERQKNAEEALKYYRRAYAFAPDESEGVFEAIDRLLRELSRPKDRVTLYRDALQYRDDPAARLTTFHTIALLEEAEIGDDDAAIETYRGALDVDETDAHSLESLARLYARRERWRDLADLTRRRAEQSALPEEEAKHRFELGQLLETRLGEKGNAIDEYQAVVEVLPPGAGSAASQGAVEALERLLKDEEHKARIIDILRPIYERADDWRHLVTVNEERLRLANDPSERVGVLRETAKLWEERGRDPQRAFDAIREAFVLDPEDGETRGELDRLAEATSRWDDLAESYEKAIEKTEDFGKRDLLGALARLHDKRRDDPRKALDAYERLFALDETDLAPLEEMDALATLLSDWERLVRILARKAELLPNDEDRASTWRRIAESKRDMLEDAAGAIQAYERALELEPDSAWTIDNLIPLYEAKNDAARLVDLYRRRIELCGEDDGELRHQLLLDAATRYETSLNDRREAIAVLSEALGHRPGDPAVTARLSKLYETEKMWPELLENLRLQAASSTGDEKRALKKRIGGLLAGELEDARGALDAYREVLEEAFDADAAKAARELGEQREELRGEAADVLEPVLRAAGKDAEVADVLEMRLRSQTDAVDRARTLRSIAQVAEARLADPQRAFDALLRALAEEPADKELHAELNRLAGTLGQAAWARYADALSERAGALFDAAVASELYVALGKVAEEHLNDDARAAKAYGAAAEQSGDAVEILAALDRLYGRLGDTKALAGVLERRVSLEASAETQTELEFRLASLQIKEFGEKSRGLATLRTALERVPDHAASRAAVEALLDDDALFQDAFETLEWVYRTLGKSAELGGLYEKRVTRARDGRERTRARLELARVLDEQVHDPAKAQRAIEAALEDDVADPDVLAELERLAPVTNGFREAADALAGALAKATDVPSATRAELWTRLAGWRRDKLQDARGAEEAFSAARALEPENVEIVKQIEDLQRAPGRERDLVGTLRARAKIEGEPETKRQLLREAKSLAEGVLTDGALVEAVLRDLLAEDDGDLWAIEELTKVREQAAAWDEVTQLLLRRAELEADGALITQLRHRAAEAIRTKLGDRARATTLYEEIFENDAADETAATALRELYDEQKKPKELVRLLERLIDVAEAEERRSSLRVELAKVKDAMGDTRDAIDTLRAILDENRGHKEAILALSTLLEKSGMDEELAELLNGQIEDARERGDVESELSLQVRLGEVFENRLKDVSRALATYEAVLARDANHRQALEAIARLSEGRSNWEPAAAALAKLLEQTSDPTEGTALALRLAKAREALKDEAGVEAALRAALRFDPWKEEVRERLRALLEKGQKWAELAELLTEDAGKLEDAFAAQDDKSPAAAAPVVKALRRVADLHLVQRKSPGDAVPLLERASALAPQDRDLLLVLCDAYNASGRERAAADVLEKVIASYGGKRSKELAAVHHRLGRALAGLGEKEQSFAQYDQAFKIDPGNVQVLRDLGLAAMESGDLDRAQKTFRALLLQKLDASSGITKGGVFFYLGEITMKQGDKPKAIQMYERALENEAGHAEAKQRLAELKG